MALSETETLGTVIPGFVTDLDGRLILTPTPDETTFGTIVPGFVTDLDGRLVITYGA